jgi:hypothetical protein
MWGMRLSTFRRAPLALFLLLLTAVGCRKGAGPGVRHPALTAADQTRPRLFLQAVVPSLERSLANIDTLRGRGALPFGGEELRTMLLANLSLPPESADVIDPTQPLGFALVARPSPGDPWGAAAFTLRSPESAAAFGAVIGNQKDAAQIRRADGATLWVLQLGTTLVAADSFEALSEAGPHAIEARKDGSQDVLVTGYPLALAHAQRIDLSKGPRPLQQKLLQDYDQQARQGRGASPVAERAAIEALLEIFVPMLIDTMAIEAALGIDPEQGLRLGVRVRPRAGTPLARRLVERAPYELDARLLSGGEPVSIGAMGPSPLLLQLYAGILQAQARAGVEGAAEVGARLRAALELITGAAAGSLRATRGGIGHELVLPLRSGVTPAAALEAVYALAASPALPALLRAAYGRHAPTVKTGRDGDTVRVEIAFPDSREPGSPGAISRALSGSSTLNLVASAAQGRLLLATDPGARARLAALAGPAPSPRIGAALQATLDETRGKDGFGHVDLWGFVRPVLSATLSGAEAQIVGALLALPGFAQLRLPLFVSFSGGESFTVELRVPVVTLKNASTALSIVGRGGAGALLPGF